MTQIPKVSLEFCNFRKEDKQLVLAREFIGMPNQFDVVSHHTGKVVRFNPIKESHPLFDYDHWDGEQAIYEPEIPMKNVETLVIYTFDI